MKIAVIGAGAVGSLYSALLKKSGNQVSLLARGKALEAISKNGIRVTSPGGDFVVHMDQISDSTANMERADAVIVAVKSWQVEGIAGQLAKLLNDDTIILPIQNGVEAYPALKKIYPANALGGLTRVICFVESPGIVKHLGPIPNVVFGNVSGQATDKMLKLRDVLQQSGISCEISSNIQKDIWEKFMTMATLGGVGSITQAPIGILRTIKETRDMLEESINEVMSVGIAYGIDLDAKSKEKTLGFMNSIPFETTSSTQRDIGSGKPSEISFLSGTVIRLARQKNLKVPLHEFIYGTLKPREMRARGELNF